MLLGAFIGLIGSAIKMWSANNLGEPISDMLAVLRWYIIKQWVQ